MKKETFDRVKADFPLIYFATSGAAITQYLMSLKPGESGSWGTIFNILIYTILALGMVFIVYVLIYRFSKKD